MANITRPSQNRVMSSKDEENLLLGQEFLWQEFLVE